MAICFPPASPMLQDPICSNVIPAARGASKGGWSDAGPEPGAAQGRQVSEYWQRGDVSKGSRRCRIVFSVPASPAKLHHPSHVTRLHPLRYIVRLLACRLSSHVSQQLHTSGMTRVNVVACSCTFERALRLQISLHQLLFRPAKQHCITPPPTAESTPPATCCAAA